MENVKLKQAVSKQMIIEDPYQDVRCTTKPLSLSRPHTVFHYEFMIDM